MQESQLKHLELIQGIISRLSQNSFLYKGWALTIVAAILAFADKTPNKWYLCIALIPSIAFWGLDAYCLRQERLFRKLYDTIRLLEETEFEKYRFSMETVKHDGITDGWFHTCFSRTVFWFYFPIVVLIVILTKLAF